MMTLRTIATSICRLILSRNESVPSSLAALVNKSPLHTSVMQCDWIRRNTPRKPETFKISKVHSLMEEDMIEPTLLNATLPQEEEGLYRDVYASVNAAIAGESSRYFAIVHMAGKQFKVTNNDLLMLKTPLFGTDVGDRIRLEKVLLVGSSSFSLIGRPLLPRDQASVEALVIEKTLESPKVWFQFHRRRRHHKMRVFQDNVAVLKITNISVSPLDESL